MKVFQVIKVNLMMCHLYPDRSKSVFDMRHLLFCAVFALLVTLHFLFLIYEAQTIEEYVRSMYMTATTLGISISFIATLFKTAQIFTMIQRLDGIVEKSMYFILLLFL